MDSKYEYVYYFYKDRTKSPRSKNKIDIKSPKYIEWKEKLDFYIEEKIPSPDKPNKYYNLKISEDKLFYYESKLINSQFFNIKDIRPTTTLTSVFNKNQEYICRIKFISNTRANIVIYNNQKEYIFKIDLKTCV